MVKLVDTPDLGSGAVRCVGSSPILGNSLLRNNMREGTLGIVFNADRDQVLVVKRRDVPVWVLPGGGVDPNESPENAVVREIFEETGVTAVVVRKVGEYTPVNRLTSLTHLYECKVVEGSPAQGKETLDAAFAPLHQLPDPFFFLHEKMLQDALKGLNYPISRPLSEVNYWSLACYFFKHPLRVARFALSRFGFPINS